MTILETYLNTHKVEVLKGKTIKAVHGLDEGSQEVTFSCTDGTEYTMYHRQDGDEYGYLSTIELIAGIYKIPSALLHRGYEDENATDEEKAEWEDWAVNFLSRDCVRAVTGSPVTYAERIELDPEELPIGEMVCTTGSADTPIRVKTLFLLATGKGVIALTWSVHSCDPMENVEIDFLQTAGEGLWKEETHET